MSRSRLPVAMILCLSLVAMSSGFLSAQRTRVSRGAPPPTNVTVVGGAASVLVSWTPLPDRGVSYRVLRALDAAAVGSDLTPPISVATFEDTRVSAGTTYFYQVVGVYADGTMGAAAPVGFTFVGPVQTVTIPSVAAKGQPLAKAPIPIGTRTPLIPPPPPPPPAPAAGPPPQGVTVTGTPSNAVLAWQAGHGATYRVDRWLESDPACCRATSPGLSPIAHGYDDDLGLTMPAATTYGRYVYRVTAHHKDGSEGFVDVTYTRPQPQKPTGFTARDVGGGTVAFQWQAVPGAIKYRLEGTGIPSTGQLATGTAATAGGMPAGPGATWKIVAVYPHNFMDLNAAAVVSSVVVRVLPPHSQPWLSKNNGAGSMAGTIAHYAPTRPSGWQVAGTLEDIGNAGLISLANVNGFRSWADHTPGPGTPNGQWDREAVYGNISDLGVGRRTDCFQEMKGPPQPGLRTVCYAAAHGIPPGDPGFDNQDTTHPVPGLGPGFLLAMMIMKDPTGTRFFVMTGTQYSTGFSVNPSSVARLDSEGAKFVPQICLSCHGGRYNAATNRVDGSYFLPLNPSALAFAGAGDLANQQEKIRRINQVMMNADAPSAVADYINGLYNGAVGQPGAMARVDFVPAGWSQQPGLYRQIVGPYCATCHIAGPTSYNFASYGSFMANKDLIFAAVCKGHTMPHSELQYKAFWTKDTGALYLPGLLAAALGRPSCS